MPQPTRPSQAAAVQPDRPHVLVVDDDAQIGALLAQYLGGQGLRVTTAGDGERMHAAMERQPVDVVLLDLGLPGEDGLALLRALRRRWQGPVIIISGRGEPVERVVGLEVGADDYVTKPFDLRELLARIRSVLRRAGGDGAAGEDRADRAFQFEGCRVDVAARRVTVAGGRDIALTTGEFDLLLALIRRPGQVRTRDELMSAMHGHEAGPADRSIDVQIGRLRKKLEPDPAKPRWIKAVRGVGYVFACPARKA